MSGEGKPQGWTSPSPLRADPVAVMQSRHAGLTSACVAAGSQLAINVMPRAKPDSAWANQTDTRNTAARKKQFTFN